MLEVKAALCAIYRYYRPRSDGEGATLALYAEERLQSDALVFSQLSSHLPMSQIAQPTAFT